MAFAHQDWLKATFSHGWHTAGVSEFCVRCGRPTAEGEHGSCHDLRASLEPPRFCPECARRMAVQVTPAGWAARCSRHGEYSSADAG